MGVKEALACQTPVVSVAVGDVPMSSAACPDARSCPRPGRRSPRPWRRRWARGRDPGCARRCSVRAAADRRTCARGVPAPLARAAAMTRNGAGAGRVRLPEPEAGGAERQWSLLCRASPARLRRPRGDARRPRQPISRSCAAGLPVACAGLRHRADSAGLVPRRAAGRASSSAVVTRGVSAHVVGHALARRQRAAHVVTEHLGPDPVGPAAASGATSGCSRPVRPRATAVVAVDRAQRSTSSGTATAAAPSG